MRTFFIFLLLLNVLNSLAFAEKILLNNGQVVDGKILEENDRQIKVDVDGIPLTYYLDEVQVIRDKSDMPSSLLSENQDASVFSDRVQDRSAEVTGEDFLSKAQKNLSLAAMDKHQLLLRYMEVTGVSGSMRKAFAEVVQNAPQEKKKNLRKVLKVEDVLNELVPVYGQYFNEKDLKELIIFYESPLGQKILKTSPLILKETTEKSMEYFKGKID
ncbi:MAG: DUF2059 domain-containing protein [Candidatus Aceula meridiana]|nr:DUF2059 domain-containing protein [Candidatus Aceula meridiana]